MLAAGKRDGGRWAGAKGKPQKSEGINYEMLSRLGVIADHARPILGACAARGRVNGSRWHHPTRTGR